MADPKPFPAKLVWLAITASVLVYGALAFALLPQVTAQVGAVPAFLPIMLGAGACAMAVLLMKSAPPGLAMHVRQLLIWVSLESVALIGMLAAWLSASGVMFLPYGLVALGLLMVARPRA